jgi:single-stranded DNA-binding protein
MEQWTDKQTGQNRSKLKFRVNEFEFVPGGKKNGNGEEPAKAPAKSAAPAKGKSAPPADNQEPEFTPAESDDGNIPF